MGLFGQKKTETAPDPEIVRAQEAASRERTDAVRNTVTRDTEMLFRIFGARRALAGASAPRPGIMLGR